MAGTADTTDTIHTIYGNYLQTVLTWGLPFQLIPNSTLNQHYKINDKVVLEGTQRPSIRYYCIGNGAHRANTDNAELHFPDLIPHRPRDAGLFNHVPFVLRRLNDDLPNERRAQYGLRKKMQYNGVDYWAYYLKRLSIADTTPQVYLDTNTNGVVTTKPFTPDVKDLTPTRPGLPATGVVVASDQYLRVSAQVTINFTEFDVTEYMNVCKIIYGVAKVAIISEIGICSGLDRDTTVDSGVGASIQMNEAVGVQIAAFISTHKYLRTTRDGFTQTLEVGIQEPSLTEMDVSPTRYNGN